MKKLPLLLKLLIILVTFYILHFTFYISPVSPAYAAESFIGVNANSLIRADLPETEREKKLQFLAEQCGVSVVRLFYPEGDYCDLNSLKSALRLGSENNIKFIITLGDSAVNNTTWFYPKDLDAYKQKALDTINSLKNEFGNAVLGWEILNEPHCNYGSASTNESCRSSFYSFMKDFSQEIKNNDPNRPVFSGVIGGGDDWMSNAWSKLDPSSNGSEYVAIHNIPAISACEDHLYPFNDSGSSQITQDIQKCQSVDKPFFVEEFNDRNPGSRMQSVKTAIETTFNNNGVGFLVWPLDGDNLYTEGNQICGILKEAAGKYSGKPFTFPNVSAIPAGPVQTACPVEIYPCGEVGPEKDPFYPYPGSSCYRVTKEPKTIVNYPVQAQKKIFTDPENYNWQFNTNVKSEGLKIPLVRQVADLFEGEEPFNRKISLDAEGNPILENFGPVSKLTESSIIQDRLKQIIAVSAIDSQGEFAPNPIHDYIIAYAIPKTASSCAGEWLAGGEDEAAKVKDSRPIRASELYCTEFLKTGNPPNYSDSTSEVLTSTYTGVICEKLYGKPFGNNNAVYPKKLRGEGKILCSLSNNTLKDVWKKFMPLVSHETEPAEITLTFAGKPTSSGKIYLPHLARLEQLSQIFQEMLVPNKPPELTTVFSQGNAVASSVNQEIVCPAQASLLSGQGGGEQITNQSQNTDPASYLLTQEGSLKVAFPELLKIKENLVGDNGFFRAWLPKEISQKIDEEVLGNDALEGEGKIKITASSGTSVNPSEISLKYPFLRSIERYYQEFLKMIYPKTE